MNTYFDLFLRGFLATGPILGRTHPWLHMGRPARPLRFGMRNRAVGGSLFVGTGGNGGSGGGGSGSSGYGDPVLIEGPGPLYGNDDSTPAGDPFDPQHNGGGPGEPQHA